MFSYFYPDLYVSSVFKIPYKQLKEKHIDTLFFDVDNTLLPHGELAPTPELVKLFKKLKSMDFKICFVSNGQPSRVARFTKEMPSVLGNFSFSLKPLGFGVGRARVLTNSLPEQIAIIGDQIFTDVLVGKRKKFFTVLVKPQTNSDIWLVAAKRGAERVVLAEYKKHKRRV
ncbi:haloacid dehalogenase [Clostridia bacterium]|nr:haloacid dehalogenase [Clostridia bacterium]GHU74291.1 haloacid dehalogenase [Clostridia bacterium]